MARLLRKAVDVGSEWAVPTAWTLFGNPRNMGDGKDCTVILRRIKHVDDHMSSGQFLVLGRVVLAKSEEVMKPTFAG